MIVNTMLLIEGDESNTFEWKINHGNDTDFFRSDSFTINEHPYFWLYAERYFNSYRTQDTWRFYLHTSEERFLPSSYTFSIVDREGQDYVTVKGKVMKKKNIVLLMTLDYYGLLSKGDFHRDSLTVRFTRNSELDAREIPSITEDRGNTSLLETLSNNFSTFYENKTDTDCVLKIGDVQFNIHRAILSARSSVFSAMFHYDTAENRSREVNIPDIEATSLSDILYYIYSGKIRGLTADTAMSMYTVADKYDLPELRTECLEYLKHNLTIDNFCEVALLAHTHGEMELEEQVAWFIEEKLDEVLESSTWQQFLKDKTLFASKLLTSGFKAAKMKQSIYNLKKI